MPQRTIKRRGDKVPGWSVAKAKKHCIDNYGHLPRPGREMLISKLNDGSVYLQNIAGSYYLRRYWKV